MLASWLIYVEREQLMCLSPNPNTIHPMDNKLKFEKSDVSLFLTYKPYIATSSYALSIIAATLISVSNTVGAETFEQAVRAELTDICSFGLAIPGSELSNICSQLGLTNQVGPGSVSSSGLSSLSQPNSLLISQQQLKDLQEKKRKKKKKGGGASSDVAVANWGSLSTFFTAGATSLRHRNNEFEQGYHADIPSVTAGVGYLFSDTLETGFAFNYANTKADNDVGGGFEIDAYSPLVYVNYLPSDNSFLNLALGYTRLDQVNERLAIAGFAANTGALVSRTTKASFNSNQYTLNFLSGYDHAIENITIGPRLGVDVRQWEMNNYQEYTNTGMELRYNDQYQTSIQTRLGLFASSAHSMSFGVLIPQVSAYWVHEFANDSRTVSARFIQAPASNGFSFQTESPDRNWAAVDVGIALMMSEGTQVFANLSTVQGNRNFESYGGNLGFRLGW